MRISTKGIIKRIFVALLIPIMIILLLILYINSVVLRELIQIILSSYILAYVFRPFHRFLVNKGINKKLAAFGIILSIIIIVIGIITFFIPILFKESLNLEKIIYEGETVLESLVGKLNLNNIGFINNNTSHIYDALNTMVIDFSQNLIDILLGLGSMLIKLALIPVLTYYLISDGEFIAKKLLLILPGKERQLLKNIARDADKVLSRYVFSQLILSFIIGVLTFIALVFLRVDFPLWLSLFNAVLNIIPYFGPIIGAIPAVLFALIQSTEKAIWTAVLMFAIQQIEGDLLSPKLVGDSISIHPVMIILLLLLGQQLGGFIGMVLAVPAAVIVKVIYEDINYHLF
ncbi:AI-2E family transporter [Alloiococcus sp. CFN-8]|uniref:AI-2E family transporter n=1 Tax=Alloiococcus sp. CFN-8 TaxID=3416081 RepID=UPI003CF8FB3B